MSGIVLSSSVRQNLLSLQSTADLLATTQNRLATGKKVNTALDNPTNFFTASSLDARASDINNLLDGISNGVQVLQAANTGITSLQKLVDSAKSVASQALQTTVGYSTKSSVSVSINGATSDNILGTGAPIDGSVAGAAKTNNQTTVYSASTGIGTTIAGKNQTAYTDATFAGSAATANSFTAYTSTNYALGSALHIGTGGATAVAGTVLNALTDGSSATPTGPQAGDTFTVNGTTISFNSGSGTTGTATAGTLNLDITSATVQDVLTAIDAITGATGGNAAAINGSGQIQLKTGIAADLTLANGTGTPLGELGLGSTPVTRGGHAPTTPALASTTLLSGTATSSNTVISTAFQANDTITVNGQTLTFKASGASGANEINIGDTVNTLLSKIDGLSGASGSNVSGGIVTLHTGTSGPLSITSSRSAALAALGVGASVSQNAGGGVINSAAVTTGTTLLSGTQVPGGLDGLTSGLTTSDYLIVNNKTITFHAGNGNTGSIGANNLSIGLGDGDIDDVLTAIGTATGGTATIDGTGKINLTTSLVGDISLAGSLSGTLTKLGLSSQTSVTRTAATTPAITGATLLSGAASSSSDALTTAFAANDTITVNGQNLTFKASGAAGNNEINITDNITTLLAKIDVLSGNTGGGAVPSAISGGVVTLHTGSANDLNISSSNTAALSALGFSAPVSQVRGTGVSALNNLTLDIASTGGGTATHLTFGSANGQVKSLNDLNNALAANNLQATLSQDGTLSITTSNDAASGTIGTISGSSALSGQLFFGKTGSTPVADAAATAQRNNLVDQYNNILNQITTTAQDASFNGVNLLGGDTLKLTFNETGKSTLSIHGVNFNAAGLGLANLNAGDFKDNESVNKVVSGLGTASSTLRSQASAFGSNLSIVQIRQDFSKNLINVLQTGSSNLTLADTNEEAANSQALSTRQSIAVSALALANQSQQSVLQLLR